MARILLAIPLALALAAPARGAPAAVSPEAGALEAVRAAESRIAPAGERAAALRGALAEPTFLDRTTGILRAGEIEPPPTPPLPASGAGPIADLLTAVRGAEEITGRIAPADLRRGMRDLRTHMREAAEALRPSIHEPDPDALPDEPALPAAVRRAAAGTPAAALLLASSLDRALPLLAALPDVPGTGEGCDVHDEPPYLCVGSVADNTYTEQYALMIDQGGNDTHLHPAGGAPFIPEGEEDAIPVAVTIDLEGDDRYVAEPVPGTSIYPAGQGFGVLGGVGILVDRAGNDVYESTAPPTSEETMDASSLSQGVGLLGGVGALFDEEGNDSYSSVSDDGVDDNVFVYGQGVGYLFGGAGALVDRGGGDDSYLLSGGTVHGLVREWDAISRRHVRQIQGQGQAYSGVGVLADDGGTDTIVAEGHARSRGAEFLLDPEWERPPVPPNALFPLAALWVQGNGIFGGVGIALTGEGPTTYEARGTADQTSQASLLVQGHGFLGASGILDDAGGNDSYISEVASEGEIAVRADAGCGCGPAEMVFEQVVSGTSAQGWAGAAGAAGALLDHGGDDRYRATNDQTLHAVAEDRRTDGASPAAVDLTAWPPPTMAQGWATVDAVGALLDAGGTDTYAFRSRLDTTATATADHAAGSRADVLVMPRLYALGAQGAARKANAAYGALLDLDGSGDRFEAEASTHATTDPAGGARTVGFLWPPFHGSADNGVFAALGDDPSIVSRPSQGVCAASTGPRGFGSWSECAAQGTDPDRQVFDVPAQRVLQSPDAQHVVAGWAPNAMGIAPGLEVDGPATLPQSEPIAAEATLTAPDGSPMTGEVVRFDLQFSLLGGPEGVVPAWFNGWEVEAVTDAEGVARAEVPSDIFGLYDVLALGFPDPGDWRLRLLATYDGAPGLYPRHVAHPLEP